MKKTLLLLLAFILSFSIYSRASSNENANKIQFKISSQWKEFSKNKGWIKLDYKNGQPVLVIKLISPDPQKVDLDDVLILKGENSIAQYKPLGIFSSSFIDGAYCIEPVYTGNMEFVRDNIIKEIQIDTQNEKLIEIISNEILTNEKLPERTEGEYNLNFKKLVDKIIENTLSIKTSNKEKSFPTSIKFIVRNIDTKQRKEIIRHLKLTLSQSQSLIEEWESYSHQDWEYSASVLY